MPRKAPPGELATELVLRTLPAGQYLWRVGRFDHQRAASLFNTTQAPVKRPQTAKELKAAGGRFDTTSEDPFGFFYASLDDLTAVAETLLRDVPFSGADRPVQWKDVQDRSLAMYETLEPLRLVALTTSAELARARQDPWLIQCDPKEFWRTRKWAHWLRRSAPEADGLLWPSKRNPGGHALVVFGDRGNGLRIAPVPVFTRALDGGAGRSWLNNRLADLNTFVVPPDHPQSRRRRGRRDG